MQACLHPSSLAASSLLDRWVVRSEGTRCPEPGLVLTTLYELGPAIHLLLARPKADSVTPAVVEEACSEW